MDCGTDDVIFPGLCPFHMHVAVDPRERKRLRPLIASHFWCQDLSRR